ncbi:MAG: hypothetical protein GF372_00845, partial [Candidatus Marinimicrobia bacterium]|nr:hypothetical protein [Candidatus Neomarinimicrobiota bacterium]
MKNVLEQTKQSKPTNGRQAPDTLGDKQKEALEQMECLLQVPSEGFDIQKIYDLSSAKKYASTGLFTCNVDSPQRCVFSLCFGDTYFCV